MKPAASEMTSPYRPTQSQRPKSYWTGCESPPPVLTETWQHRS